MIEITDFVRETPKIKESRSIAQDLTFPSDCDITVNDASNAFSMEHPSSIFAGLNWQNDRLRVWDRYGLLIWDGLVGGIVVNHSARTTTIKSKSRLHEWRAIPVVYSSGGAETPAAALGNIATAIGFPYLDEQARQASEDRQTAAGITLDCVIAASDNATFEQVVQKLADYGVADIYEHLGQLFYVHYQDTPASPIVFLDEDDMVSDPAVLRRTTDLINDYSIAWIGGLEDDVTNGNIGAASRTANGTRILQTVQGTVETQYPIETEAGAIAIGETYMRRSHIDISSAPRPRIQVSFDLPVEHREWVDLTSDFGLTFAREGWTRKTFRVTAFERDDNRRRIKITGLEWPQ